MDSVPETFLALTEWFQSDLGRAVVAAENAQLGHVLGDYFGYHALQVEGAPQLLGAHESPINHRVWLSFTNMKHAQFPTVRTHSSFLPFREDSIDLILLPHVLEFVEDPKNLLNEIQRVLIPEGRLIIFGFNPSSLWGLAHLLQSKKNMPWAGRFYGITHVRYWLQQHPLLEEKMQTFFFSLPSQHAKRRQKYRFLEALGRMCWPWSGGLYMIIVRKQMSTLTPLRFEKKKLHFSSPKKIIAPTARQMKHE
jgi:SAM-dependent methyltransferase